MSMAIGTGNNDANSTNKLEEKEIGHEMDLFCSDEDYSMSASTADGAMYAAAREGDTTVGAGNNAANSEHDP